MEKQRYHFIGIGGIGMGAIARLLIAKSYPVSGSDIKENQLTAQLRQMGANIFIGHDPKNIGDAQVVVYSTAIKKNNCEFIEAESKKIKLMKRAELLAQLMDGHFPITIAGAHGKTTTTSMISNMLSKNNFHPTTAIGGILNETSTNAQLGNGKYFVAEVDESDGSFLYFSPKISVITNIDYEHLDFYKNWENILYAYNNFILNTKNDGVIIACGEDNRLLSLLKKNNINYVTYGFSNENTLRAQNISFEGFSVSYDCMMKNEKLGRVNLKVPGKHNVLNSLACIGVGISLSISFDCINNSLSSFSGVNRRFQLLGNVNDITIIDDYAHHPTEIEATLKAANNIKKSRTIAVFQPHRYSRLQSLLKEFAFSLTNVDSLIITDIYAASEEPVKGLTSQSLVNEIKKNLPDTRYVKKEDLVKKLLDEIKPGDLVLTLGAGDITKTGYELMDILLSQNQLQNKCQV